MKKLSQQQVANILKVVLTVATFALLYSMSGCSSTHYRNKTKEKTKKMTTRKPQYAFFVMLLFLVKNFLYLSF